MYLVFDTETTGLPKNYNAPVTDTANWPRIIQLAWAYYGEDGKLMNSRCELIKPDGWTIPTEKFWTDNGYSQAKSEELGVPIASVLEKFNNALYTAKYLIAHNMSFDEKILGAEYVRLGMSSKNKPKKICTKLSSTDFCQIPGPRGFKWPNLTELHVKLFGEKFVGAHDAMNDVNACAKCFFKLKELNIIKLN